MLLVFLLFFFQQPRQLLLCFLWLHVVLGAVTWSPSAALLPVSTPLPSLSHGNKTVLLWTTSSSTLQYRKAVNSSESVRFKSADRTGMQENASNVLQIILQENTMQQFVNQVRLMQSNIYFLYLVLIAFSCL